MAENRVKLPELLTIRQVAKILNVHPTTLRRWDKIGKLKAIRVGTRRGVGACPPLEGKTLPPTYLADSPRLRLVEAGAMTKRGGYY